MQQKEIDKRKKQALNAATTTAFSVATTIMGAALLSDFSLKRTAGAFFLSFGFFDLVYSSIVLHTLREQIKEAKS